MGVFIGAKVCGLVGTFHLYNLSLKYNRNNICFYRDDGLAIFKIISGPKLRNVKKNIKKLLRDNELDMVNQHNVKRKSLLDVTLHLKNSTYHPFQKESNQIKYINIESNLPPSMIKKLSFSIESRLSSLSSSQEIFKDSVTLYQNALDTSGFKHKLN